MRFALSQLGVDPAHAGSSIQAIVALQPVQDLSAHSSSSYSCICGCVAQRENRRTPAAPSKCAVIVLTSHFAVIEHTLRQTCGSGHARMLSAERVEARVCSSIGWPGL